MLVVGEKARVLEDVVLFGVNDIDGNDRVVREVLKSTLMSILVMVL